MSVEEELQEEIEKAKEPFDKHVAATMAILAAFLAVVAVLGHIMTTEELLLQQKASDQWSYYQAKSIRRYQSEVARDLFAGMKLTDQSADVSEERGEIPEGRRRDSEGSAGAGARESSARPAGARIPFRRSISRILHRLGVSGDPDQAPSAVVCVHCERRRWRCGGGHSLLHPIHRGEVPAVT